MSSVPPLLTFVLMVVSGGKPLGVPMEYDAFHFGCFVHHADSFTLARNGRLDATLLGAYQVAENGDLANWRLPRAKLGSIGGAMDLAAGAKRVIVMMTSTIMRRRSPIRRSRTAA